MGAADDQIRVSEEVKRKIERRRRGDESYNDVLERLLEDDRDLLSGFGRWSDERADEIRERREEAKRRSKERMERLAENG